MSTKVEPVALKQNALTAFKEVSDERIRVSTIYHAELGKALLHLYAVQKRHDFHHPQTVNFCSNRNPMFNPAACRWPWTSGELFAAEEAVEQMRAAWQRYLTEQRNKDEPKRRAAEIYVQEKLTELLKIPDRQFKVWIDDKVHTVTMQLWGYKNDERPILISTLGEVFGSPGGVELQSFVKPYMPEYDEATQRQLLAALKDRPH